jgi:hypothetical protein
MKLVITNRYSFIELYKNLLVTIRSSFFAEDYLENIKKLTKKSLNRTAVEWHGILLSDILLGGFLLCVILHSAIEEHVLDTNAGKQLSLSVTDV